MTSQWKEVRVFISSTFRDMHSERDWLVKRVFPELRERLLPYRLHLVDIDLRWGITEEQSHDDRVLDLCLDEIDRSRPFFVGILGERYGFVPRSIAPRALSRYGWIQAHTGKSITELEILYGVLNDRGMRNHSFFYYRDPSFIREVPDGKRADLQAEDDESAGKLAGLKQRIRAAELPVPPMVNYPCRYRGLRINWRLARHELDDAAQSALHGVAADGIVDSRELTTLPEALRSFVLRCGSVQLDGLETFGQRVLDDLWSGIQTRYELSDSPPTTTLPKRDPLAGERDYHDRFIEHRTRVFVGRRHSLDQLHAVTEHDDVYPALIVAPPGMGKSALLARFCEEYRQRHPDNFLLAHFVGAGPRSTILRDVLRRLCEEIRLRFDYRDALEEEGEETRYQIPEIPFDLNELARTFQAFVSRIPSDRHAVIVLDALNQLDEAESAQALSWLPREWPPHVDCIMSCTAKPDLPDRPILEAFRGRKCYTIRLEDLTNQEQFAILTDVPSVSAKTLDPRQVQLLLDNPATRNPLFLLVALEELRGFGSFEYLTARIRAFPHEGDTITAIFAQVIERLEEEFDHDAIHNLLVWLATAKAGLSEYELGALLEATEGRQSRNDLFPILRQLRPYLEQRGACITFHHAGLMNATRLRYLRTPGQLHGAHDTLATFFGRQDYWLEEVDAVVSSVPGSGRRLVNDRKATELPYHMIQRAQYNVQEQGFHAAERDWNALVETLTDADLLAAKSANGSVYDVPELIRRAMGIHPGSSRWFPSTESQNLANHRYAVALSAHADHPTESGFPCAPVSVLKRERERPTHDAGIASLLSLSNYLSRISCSLRFLDAYGLIPGFLEQEAAHWGDTHSTTRPVQGRDRSETGYWRLRNDLSSGSGSNFTRVVKAYDSRESWISLSWNSEHILALGDSKCANLWELGTGKCRGNLRIPEMVTCECLASTPDLRTVAAVDLGRTLYRIEPFTGSVRPLSAPELEFACSISILPNGRVAATGHKDGRVCLWDLEARRCVKSQVLHDGPVVELQLAADGSLIATATGWDLPVRESTIKIWFTDTFDPAMEIAGFEHGQSCLAVSPEFDIVLFGDSVSGRVRMHDARSGDGVREIFAHDGAVTCALVTADTMGAVTGGSDGFVRLWDLTTGECLRELHQANSKVVKVSATPDARVIVAAYDDGYHRIWDSDPPSTRAMPEARHTGSVISLARLPDGRIASAGLDNRVSVWDPMSAQCEETFSPPSTTPYVVGMAEGTGSVLLRKGDALSLWDPAGGTVIGIPIPDGERVSNIVIAPRGDRLAFQTVNSIFVWYSQEDRVEPLLQVDARRDGRIAFSRDSNSLVFLDTYGSDGFVCNLRTGVKVPLRMLANHHFVPYEVRFSSLDKRIVCTMRDGIVIWEVGSDEVPVMLPAPTHSPVSAAIVDEHDTLITCGGDGAICVRNVCSGEFTGLIAASDTGVLSVLAERGVIVAGTRSGHVLFYSRSVVPSSSESNATVEEDA